MTKEEILEKVERDFNMGGLSSGLYADYALEVAEIYKDQELSLLTEKLKDAEELIKHQGQSILRRQEKYNKLKEAFEEILDASVKMLYSGHYTSAQEITKDIWMKKAGLKEQ